MAFIFPLPPPTLQLLMVTPLCNPAVFLRFHRLLSPEVALRLLSLEVALLSLEVALWLLSLEIALRLLSPEVALSPPCLGTEHPQLLSTCHPYLSGPCNSSNEPTAINLVNCLELCLSTTSILGRDHKITPFLHRHHMTIMTKMAALSIVVIVTTLPLSVQGTPFLVELTLMRYLLTRMKGGLKLHCILQVCTIHLSNSLLTTLLEQDSPYQGANSCSAEQGTLFSSSNFLLMQLSEPYNQPQDEQDPPQLDAT